MEVEVAHENSVGYGVYVFVFGWVPLHDPAKIQKRAYPNTSKKMNVKNVWTGKVADMDQINIWIFIQIAKIKLRVKYTNTKIKNRYQTDSQNPDVQFNAWTSTIYFLQGWSNRFVVLLQFLLVRLHSFSSFVIPSFFLFFTQFL